MKLKKEGISNRLYIDKSDRLCGTMRIKDFLRSDSPMGNDWVKRIYSDNGKWSFCSSR